MADRTEVVQLRRGSYALEICPGQGGCIAAERPFGYFVAYGPPGRDFLCVEPVSPVNDGFNLLDRGFAGAGVRILAPGVVVRLSVA